MVNTKDIKQRAIKAYNFDIGRNAGVEFISFIIKFALFFALATVYIICLAKMGTSTVSPLTTIIFAAVGALIYFFVVAPINLGRNVYFAKVAAKTQPEIDEMFWFYSKMKLALYAYFRIAVAILFYSFFFTALTIVYFRVFSALSTNIFSFWNFFICAAIIVFYVMSILITRMKYSLLAVVYQKFEPTKAHTFVAKTIRCSKGVKSDLFLLYLSFAGWYILGLISFGIGFIWINPYIRIATKIYLNERIQ